MPPVSVIVICRDRVPHVSRCVASLLAQEGVSLGFDYEIIVVEQGNGNRKILAGLPVRHIVLPYGRTTSMAWLRNVGTRRARFDWLYHMDCDMILRNRTVSKLRNQIGDELSAVPRVYGMTRRWGLTEKQTRQVQADPALPIRFGKYLTHGNPVLFHRPYLEWLGGYDERFWGHGCEDLDMMARVERTGGVCVHLRLYAWHQWHGESPVRTANRANWKLYRTLRRKMRSDPALAIRNPDGWGEGGREL